MAPTATAPGLSEGQIARLRARFAEMQAEDERTRRRLACVPEARSQHDAALARLKASNQETLADLAERHGCDGSAFRARAAIFRLEARARGTGSARRTPGRSNGARGRGGHARRQRSSRASRNDGGGDSDGGDDPAGDALRVGEAPGASRTSSPYTDADEIGAFTVRLERRLRSHEDRIRALEEGQGR